MASTDRNHRPDRILAALALLFLLDAITTTVGIHHGLTESNPYASSLFEAFGPHLAIALITIGKLVVVLALDAVARHLPHQHGYRIATYSVLVLVHVQVVASNVQLLV